MSPTQVIVLATPAFLVLIGFELAWGLLRSRNTYRLNDALTSLSVGMVSQLAATFTRLFRVGIYAALYELAPWHVDGFWTTWWGALLALVFYDFCYYWQHRAGHEIALFWAGHAVHHHGEDFNLATALRQSATSPLTNWIFFIPMALAGVPPLVFGIVVLVDLLYQFWVHTDHVPKLGWFDRWFCSPSNHRVHHAMNDCYVDRNYGGLLIVWDRLFGTFVEEGERCVYGTRAPLRSWDPLWANAEGYWALARDAWRARRWSDKLRLWVKPPGWRPADVAARFPKPAFDLARVERFEPALARGVAAFGIAQFAALLAGVLVFLWHVEALPLARSAVWLCAFAAGLWAMGALMQGRIGMIEVLLVDVAALATATSAEGLVELHRVFKPLAMMLAIACVTARLDVRGSFAKLLVAGLACSLAGDAFLMFDGFFIPGLVAFLLAHLCYLALLKRGQRWFPSGRALAATLGIGAAMYAYLYPSLGPVLKGAVAAYVAVIALMAAQAIGRATTLRDRNAVAVAAGACCFMLSDATLAINKFAVPVPMAAFWILASYYAAQALIACNATPAGAGQPSPNSSPALLGGATPR